MDYPVIDTKSLTTLAAAGRVHVLFLVDQLCEMGGAEKILLRMLRLMPQERFRCSVVTFKIDSRLPIFRDFPCRLEILPLERTYGLSGMRVAKRLRSIIRSEKVQIVHTFFETADLWGGMIARLSGCPVLISSRRDMGIMRSRMHGFAYRALTPLFDEVQTVSEEVRRFCIEHDRIDPRKIRTVYNGVAPSEEASGSPRGLPAHVSGLIERASHVITTLGHLRPVKNYELFIRSAAAVHKRYPDAAFIVAGETNDRAYYGRLTELAATLGVAESVHFVGNVADSRALLAASNVFCLLSRSEGMSNALLEAMAEGLPSVVTRVGGNPELIAPGLHGYLVDVDDHVAASEAIVRLLENPQLAQEMGERSRHRIVEQFSETVMMETLVKRYEALLSARS